MVTCRLSPVARRRFARGELDVLLIPIQADGPLCCCDALNDTVMYIHITGFKCRMRESVLAGRGAPSLPPPGGEWVLGVWEVWVWGVLLATNPQ